MPKPHSNAGKTRLPKRAYLRPGGVVAYKFYRDGKPDVDASTKLKWGVSKRQNEAIEKMIEKAHLDFEMGGAGLLRQAVPALGEWMLEFDKVIAKDKAAGTEVKYVQMSRDIKQSSIAKLRIDEITIQHANTLLTEYADRFRAPHTRNVLISVLSGALNYAYKCKIIDQPLKFEYEDQRVRERMFIPEEETAYFGAITDKRWRAFITIMRYAGCRPEEVLKLRWELNFDWDRNILLIRKNARFKGKTKNAMRVLMLCPEIWIALEELGVEEKGWVFPAVQENSKQGHISHNWPTEMHNKTIEDSGITFNDEHKGKLVLYCWRHTFATDCINNGMDIVHLKDVLGHSTIQQTMRYVHINEESILRQMQLVQQRIHENIQRRKLRLA